MGQHVCEETVSEIYTVASIKTYNVHWLKDFQGNCIHLIKWLSLVSRFAERPKTGY